MRPVRRLGLARETLTALDADTLGVVGAAGADSGPSCSPLYCFSLQAGCLSLQRQCYEYTLLNPCTTR